MERKNYLNIIKKYLYIKLLKLTTLYKYEKLD